MEFETNPHRHANEVLNTAEFKPDWSQFTDVISGITDEDIIARFKERDEGKQKSLAKTINFLIRQRLTEAGWKKEVAIFHDSELKKEKTWRLDFAKPTLSVEVAFNHGEATAWNLFKPVLASELNHVEKAVQTKAGIVVFATQELKDVGGFDSAIMTYERASSFLRAFHNLISVPLMLVGLRAPKAFNIVQKKDEKGKKRGFISLKK